MKITIATGIFPPDIGGPATYVNGLAPELMDRGWEVEVVTYGDDGPEPSAFPVRRVSRKPSLPARYASYFRATRAALRGDANLAYVQDPVSAGLPATLAAMSLSKPTVVKIVGDLAWEISRDQSIVNDEVDEFQTKRYGALVETMRRAQRFVVRRASRVITPSHYLKDLVCGWGARAEDVHVIENGIRAKAETRKTRDEARHNLGLEGGPILITAGRLVPWKGFETVIESMPAILREHPGARLLIVGSGPREASLRALIATLELGDAVELLGSRPSPELAMHLKASDIFVLASTYEGFSHLLLEAMQSELPIVASRAGGNPEIVTDGENGLLVEPVPHDVETALLRLLADPALRQRLAQSGKARARDFTWESMVSRTASLLQEVVES